MTQEEKRQFLRDVLENLPEYAVSFACERYDHKRTLYQLRDLATDTVYVLTLPRALRGFNKLTRKIEAGQLHFTGLGPDYKVDAGQWDADAVDALLQTSVLGEVVYG